MRHSYDESILSEHKRLDKLHEIFRRPGQFRISMDGFEQHPEGILQIMSRVIISKVEHDIYINGIRYWGHSLSFDLQEEENFIHLYHDYPHYTFMFMRNASGRDELQEVLRIGKRS
jgi:hypothetical protein